MKSNERNYHGRVDIKLRDVDLSKYGDSMRPLIEKDIRETEKFLKDYGLSGR